MEVTVGVGNEIPPSKVIENRCENNSQLDDLLAAYDLHELASKMADHPKDITTTTAATSSVGSGDEGTSISTLGMREKAEKEEEEEGEQKEEETSVENNNKIEENGDHETELTWDTMGMSMEEKRDATPEFVEPMEETPDKITETSEHVMSPIQDKLDQIISAVPEPSVVKVKRHRRKRPPNKSILKPIFSPEKQQHQQLPLATSTPGTTDGMIQSIPDLFRNMGTPHDLPPVSSPRAGNKPSSHKDMPIFNSNIGVLDQIRQPVLPVYGSCTGPPSRLHLSVPETGYICPDCSDRFWLESGFAQHVQRRSVYINFFCNFCSKLLVFYNRCALLGHARIHQERQQPCDVSSATLAALDKDLIPCVQESRNAHLVPSAVPPSFVSEMRVDNRVAATKRKRNSPVSVKNVPVSVPEIARSAVNHNCSECKQVCKNATELAVHFGEDREAPPSTDSECTQCHMICASRCSLVAHQRMHAKTAPHVCPECGLKVSNVWQEYKTHVTESCLHHSRMLGFRCPACGILSVNPEHLKTHVISDHKVTLYKCESCPKAFKSVKSFENHRRSIHSNTEPNTNYTWIQQCPLCETVIHQQNLLNKHLEIHFQEIFAAAKYVFRCLECGLLSENKADLSEHLKTSHSYPTSNHNEKKTSSKSNKRKAKPSNEETATNVDKLTVYCNHCKRAFRTVLGLNVHRFRSHGIRINESQMENYSAVETTFDQSYNNNGTDKPPPITIKFKKKKKCDTAAASNYTLERSANMGNGNLHEDENFKLKCKLCYDMFPDTRSLIEHGNLHIQEGFFVCMLCSNLTFTNKIALGRHLEKHASTAAFPISCLYCQSVLEERTEAAVHWRDEHGLSSFQCPYCDIRYLYHKSLSRHVRESHNGGKKLKKKASSQPEMDELGGDETSEMKCTEEEKFEVKMEDSKSNEEKPETKVIEAIAREEQDQDEEGEAEDDEAEQLVCAKCDFQSKKRAQFLRHICQHRGEMDEGFQCLECGTCFVVEPSLHKHLKLVHKVKDVECYLKSMKVERAMSDLVNAANNNCSEKWEGGMDDEDGNFELKCTICHLFFENEQMLKTHSRSHGMAFLQAAASKRTNSSDTSISSPTSTPTKIK